ncbi:MAG: hypothetical protein IRZ16_21695 [Myxococcaceae bacterium]|nr:hypothetical protein [Myxococcaceae bacterium]
MNARQLILFVAVLLVAAFILRLAFWRAVLFFRPKSLRIDAEDPPGKERVPKSLARLTKELEALGFVPLGSHSERPLFGPVTICFDYARAENKTFATIFESRWGAPRLYFMSLLAGGPGFVITANYRRPAKELPGRYISGWLEDIPADRVFRAHVRRIEGMALEGTFTQAARLEYARAFADGPGVSEARQEHVQGLLWTFGSLGMVAAAIFGTLRSMK